MWCVIRETYESTRRRSSMWRCLCTRVFCWPASRDRHSTRIRQGSGRRSPSGTWSHSLLRLRTAGSEHSGSPRDHRSQPLCTGTWTRTHFNSLMDILDMGNMISVISSREETRDESCFRVQWENERRDGRTVTWNESDPRRIRIAEYCPHSGVVPNVPRIADHIGGRLEEPVCGWPDIEGLVQGSEVLSHVPAAPPCSVHCAFTVF